jgi:hypothetical protein
MGLILICMRVHANMYTCQGIKELVTTPKESNLQRRWVSSLQTSIREWICFIIPKMLLVQRNVITIGVWG